MENYGGTLHSKLPGTGPSIFAVMSQLANENNAINLAQGFPDFPIANHLITLVNKYMKKGYNQYAPMPGVRVLRSAIADKVKKMYGADYDPDHEITITAGATQAIFAVLSTMIRPDDEVIVFEPAYDSYAPGVKINGGLVKYAALNPSDFSINWDSLPTLFSNRTRMIILNSPHNPSGSVLKQSDLQRLEKLIHGRDIMILSDEVYEHLIFDGLTHQSICLYPELAKNSFVIGSFGKTFHATGWKTGFVLAPANLTSEFRKTHQFMVFAANTPIQHAFAEYLQNENHYNNLAQFFQVKRDMFLQLIAGSGFEPLPCHGTYFQVLCYSQISDEKEYDFAVRLTKDYKIASVPLSAFYNKNNENQHLRFCFAKTERTLKQAAKILRSI
ncbi:MAG TPA: methionine aminotransferase [Bacteroidales bacterium]|nr:methionine aminotransferase [Bacteroidales bacterium]